MQAELKSKELIPHSQFKKKELHFYYHLKYSQSVLDLKRPLNTGICIQLIDVYSEQRVNFTTNNYMGI